MEDINAEQEKKAKLRKSMKKLWFINEKEYEYNGFDWAQSAEACGFGLFDRHF